MKNRNGFKKIFGRSGASMLIAILVFLLAVLSGTVALTMASSNAGRYTHEKEEQQAYLSVVSAAKLIVRTLDDFEVYFQTKDSNLSLNNVEITYQRNGAEIGKGEEENLFLGDKRFRDNLLARSADTEPPYEDISFTLSVDGMPGMGSVYVTLYLSSSSITFRLWSENGNRKDYQMSILIETYYEQNNYISENDDKGKALYWYRTMKFKTSEATFTVENNVPSA